jgi:hypothetical protein
MSMGKATDTTTDASASTSADSATAAVSQAVTEFVQGIEEFCANLSATDRRIEMIGAFYRVEMAAGRTRALPSEFKVRYSAFLTQPA